MTSIPVPSLWVNDKRTILVSVWRDGTITAATREDSDAIWGPPMELLAEGSEEEK